MTNIQPVDRALALRPLVRFGAVTLALSGHSSCSIQQFDRGMTSPASAAPSRR